MVLYATIEHCRHYYSSAIKNEPFHYGAKPNSYSNQLFQPEYIIWYIPQLCPAELFIVQYLGLTLFDTFLKKNCIAQNQSKTLRVFKSNFSNFFSHVRHFVQLCATVINSWNNSGIEIGPDILTMSMHLSFPILVLVVKDHRRIAQLQLQFAKPIINFFRKKQQRMNKTIYKEDNTF